MNTTLTVPAYAKLNISIDITGKLPDGYHAMRMIMQSASLCDDVTVTLLENGCEFKCRTNLNYLPTDERNIAVQAAKLFLTETGLLERYGADITMHKRIPVCAGLGGGSSDAAAVLLAMNELTGAACDTEKLLDMARQLGSDVPFCIEGGTALATGRGDILTQLPPLPDCHFVICKPEFSISTPKLFQRINLTNQSRHPDTDGIISALETEDLGAVARRMYNVFEDVLPRRFAEIGVIKLKLLDYAAMGIAMSGTGSSVFGIFDSEASARAAFEGLREEYRYTFLEKPIPHRSLVQ